MADTSQETANQNQAPQLDPYLTAQAEALATATNAAFNGEAGPNAATAKELKHLAEAMGIVAGALATGSHELNKGDEESEKAVLGAFGTLVDLSRVPFTTHVQTPSLSEPSRGLVANAQIHGTLATYRGLQYTHEVQFEGDGENDPIDPEFLVMADTLIDMIPDYPDMLKGSLVFIALQAWARMDREERRQYVGSVLSSSPAEKVLEPARQALGVIDRLKRDTIIGKFWGIGHSVVPHSVDAAGQHVGKLFGAFTERQEKVLNDMERRARRQTAEYLGTTEDVADGSFPIEHTLAGWQVLIPRVIPREKVHTTADFAQLAKAIALRVPLRLPEIFTDPNASPREKQLALLVMRTAATDLSERPEVSVLQKADAKAAAAQAQGSGKKKK